MNQRLKSVFPLLLFVVALIALQNTSRIRLWFDPIATEGLQRQDVVMYATSWCPYCEKARDFLENAGIPYTEYDIEQSARARKAYEQLGGGGVPVIKVGDAVVRGFDPGALRQAVDRLASERG